MPKKKTIEEAIKLFDDNGWTLLSTIYIDSKEPMAAICPKGHRTTKNYNNVHSGRTGCRICTGNPEYKIADIKIALEKEGYELLSDKYTYAADHLEAICPNGHYRLFTWKDFNNNETRCPDCQGKTTHTLEKVRDIFKKEGYLLLVDNYHSCMVKLPTTCPNGHPYGVRLNDFLSKHSRCTRCRLLINESECRNILEDIFGSEFVKCRPDFLLKSDTRHRLELDGFNKELMIAFEYDGESHFNPVYGDESLNKTRKNDFLKDELCKKEGVTLIRIPYTVKDKEKYIKEELTKRGIKWPACQ